MVSPLIKFLPRIERRCPTPYCKGVMYIDHEYEGDELVCHLCSKRIPVKDLPKISSSPRRAGGKYRGMGVDTHGLD